MKDWIDWPVCHWTGCEDTTVGRHAEYCRLHAGALIPKDAPHAHTYVVDAEYAPARCWCGEYDKYRGP